MWEKFKESKFAKKCSELSHRGGVVAAVLCLVLVLTVALSVTIATNRAKKKYGNDDQTLEQNGTNQTESVGTENEKSTNSGIVEGTVDIPSHNDATESLPVSGEPEEFKLELPVDGIIGKGHDATIQVWSETMEDYRVHLGIDITTKEGAPVYATADGVVAKVWDDALMGRCVAISHGDEIFTFYKNLDPILCEGIEANAKITCGQQIGKVGESAIAEIADEPHLHIEMTVNGLAVDPADYFSDEARQSLSKDNSFESSVSGNEATTENVNAEK